jgi:hypothetical protein
MGYVQRVPVVVNNNPESESFDVRKARLAFEAATEANDKASKIFFDYKEGARLMQSAQLFINKAATEKQDFSNAIHEIKDLALKHPLLARDIRDILAPVYMTVEDNDDLVDIKAGSHKVVDIKSIPCIQGDGGGLACSVDENCPSCRAYGIENDQEVDKTSARMRQRNVKSEQATKRSKK